MRLTACLLLATAFAMAADPVQTFEQAVRDLSSRNYSAAEEGFNKVLQASPKHIPALQNLGVVYSRTGRLHLAIDAYRRALALSPNHKSLLMNLGLAYVQRESYSEALPVFRTLLQVDPVSLPARELLATSELYTGQVSSAVGRFETLRAEDPQNADLVYLLCLGYLKLGRSPATLVAEQPPPQGALALCKAYGATGRFEEAVEYCRQAASAESQFPGVHRELGKALLNLRDSSAPAELTLALRQDPADAEALYSMGVALQQEDRLDEAAPYLERARDLRPAYWGSYFYLGKARLQLKRPAEAVPLLQRATELNPRAAVLFYELGRALKAAGKAAESAQAMQRVRELRALELAADAGALQKP